MQIQKSSTSNTTESSVLFSLATLGAMAAPPPAVPPPAAKVEDLLGIGALPSPVLAAPAIAPVTIAKAAPVAHDRTRAWILAASIVAFGILGGSYAAARSLVQPRPTHGPSATLTTVATIVPTDATGTRDTPDTVVAAPSDETVAPVAPVVPEIPVAPIHARVRPRHDEPVVAPIAPVVTPPSTHPPTIEELMRAVTHDEPTTDVTPPSPTSHASTAPSREAVVSAMHAVTPAVSQCGPDHGIATVEMTVARDGHVTSALVSGPLAGTPTGSCVARAARTATLPAFDQASFRFTYPFRL